MAYLDPETLTCPKCGRTGDLVWIIGEGPNTKPGQGPDYVDVMEDGIWKVETKVTVPEWAGKITCPDCATGVKNNP